jgi:hypothetical protein
MPSRPQPATAPPATVELTHSSTHVSYVRFDADESTDTAAIRNVYVHKSTVAAMGNPDRIRISIEAVSA